MYKLTEDQRNTLLYIIERLTVTGPIQGGMLNNAGGILQSLQLEKKTPESEPKTDIKKEDN